MVDVKPASSYTFLPMLLTSIDMHKLVSARQPLCHILISRLTLDIHSICSSPLLSFPEDRRALHGCCGWKMARELLMRYFAHLKQDFTESTAMYLTYWRRRRLRNQRSTNEQGFPHV